MKQKFLLYNITMVLLQTAISGQYGCSFTCMLVTLIGSCHTTRRIPLRSSMYIVYTAAAVAHLDLLLQSAQQHSGLLHKREVLPIVRQLISL
jgi:hypothetical protein